MLPLMGAGPSAVGGNGLSAYATKVLTYSPFAYWQLNEASGTDAFDISGNSFDGTYTNCTLGQTGIGDGGTSALFDNNDCFVDVYSTSFRDSFPYDEGSITGWMKVFNAGFWEDGSNRSMVSFSNGLGGAAYSILYLSPSNNNQLRYFRDDGDNNEVNQVVSGMSETNWAHFGLSWSVISGNMKAYLSGSQIGSTQAGVLAAQDVLVSTLCAIGDIQNSANYSWHGWLAHVAVIPSILDGTDITDLATV